MASAAKNVSNLLGNSRQHTINHHFLKEVGEKQRHSVLSAMNHCHPRKSLDNNLGGLLEVKCTVEGDQLHRLLAFFAVGIGSIVNLVDHWRKLSSKVPSILLKAFRTVLRTINNIHHCTWIVDSGRENVNEGTLHNSSAVTKYREAKFASLIG